MTQKVRGWPCCWAEIFFNSSCGYFLPAGYVSFPRMKFRARDRLHLVERHLAICVGLCNIETCQIVTKGHQRKPFSPLIWTFFIIITHQKWFAHRKLIRMQDLAFWALEPLYLPQKSNNLCETMGDTLC